MPAGVRSHDFQTQLIAGNNKFTSRNRQDNWRDTELTTDIMTLVESRGINRFGGQGVEVIIAGSMEIDAEVINLNTDSIIPAVDRVFQRNGAFSQNGQNSYLNF
ncbi:hypothetical protein TNCV_1000101 [Trichonephila clavipes]|nr:hypothetical protein TNCV_1000101 [Trichonephila clavipes]